MSIPIVLLHGALGSASQLESLKMNYSAAELRVILFINSQFRNLTQLFPDPERMLRV